MMTVGDNFRAIGQRVELACERAGRDPKEVIIVGAAKQVKPERICQAVEAGLKHVGENYVHEALEKVGLLPASIERHFIGHLQTNKVRQVVPVFDWVHSMDRVGLAEEISKRAVLVGRVIRGLVEVNLGYEESKSGVAPERLAELLSAISGLPGIAVVGLMAIPPARENPEESRRDFREMRTLSNEMDHRGISRVSMQYLSMGMTNDFDVAIEEGANIIRVGTGIFGPRS